MRFIKFNYRTLCCILALSFILLSACSQSGSETHFTAFNSTTVTVQARNKTLSETAKEEIRALLESLNAEFSATETGSTTYKINNATSGEKIEISERFKFIAEQCKSAHSFTGGKFDPSVYPLTLLWQFAPNFPVPNFTLPAAEEISAAKSLVGLDKFDFSDGAGKTMSGAKLDFGGALKGYAADEIAKIMKNDGVTEGFVNVGGSSLYLLSVDKLSVTHPRDDGNILTVKIKGKDLAVSTSGDYEKVYSANGKKYSHIINPTTGYPAETGAASVTLIGKNGLILDALTTAACICSHDFNQPENGKLYEFIIKILSNDEFKNAEIFAVCVGDKKQILTNKKQGEDFTLLDNSYEIITVNLT